MGFFSSSKKETSSAANKELETIRREDEDFSDDAPSSLSTEKKMDAVKKDENKLSKTSKLFDVDGDGELNEIEQKMRDLDSSGKGHLSNEAVYAVFKELDRSQKELLGNKRLISALVVAIIFQSILMFGIVYLTVYLNKQFDLKSSGLMIGKNGERIVMGGLSFDVPDLEINGVDKPKACISMDMATSMYDSALAMIPMNLRVAFKDGYGFDKEEFSFEIPAVQRNEQTICFQNGHNKAFACVEFENDECDQLDESTNGAAALLSSSEKNSLRRLAFSHSLDTFRGVQANEYASPLRRKLQESSDAFSNILLTLDFDYETNSLAEESVYEVTSGNYYTLIYRVDGSRKRYLKADTPVLQSWKFGIDSWGDKKAAKDLKTFFSGPAAGLSVLLVDEAEADTTLPEFHWRWVKTNTDYRNASTYHLINRLSGRGIKKIPDTVKDGKFKLESGSYGYLSMDSRSSEWQRFYFTSSSDGSGLEMRVWDSSNIQGNIYEANGKLASYVRSTHNLNDCMYNHNDDQRCIDKFCSGSSTNCPYFNAENSAGGCFWAGQKKPRCYAYRINSSSLSPNEFVLHTFLIEMAPDPSLWAPPDLVSDSGYEPTSIGGYGTSTEWVRGGNSVLEDKVDEVKDLTFDVVSDLADELLPFLGTVGIGVIELIFKKQENDDSLEDIYEDMNNGFNEIRSEIQVIAEQISARDRINTAWALMEKARKTANDKIITYKYGVLFGTAIDQKVESDYALQELYDAAIKEGKTAIDVLRCDGDVLAQCKLSCFSNTASCTDVEADDDTVIEDQYLYTIRFGWHSIFILSYFQYMELVQEYLLLAAYSLSAGYHIYIIQYNADVANGLNPVNCLENGFDSLLARAEIECEHVNLLHALPDMEEFDYALSMLEEAYNHVMMALDNNHNFEEKAAFDDYCDTATNGVNGGTSYLWSARVEQYELWEGQSNGYGNRIISAQEAFFTDNPSSSFCSPGLNRYVKISDETIAGFKINSSNKFERFLSNPVYNALKDERIIAAELYYSLNEIYEYHRNALEMTRSLFNAILIQPEVYKAIAQNEMEAFGE